MISVTELSELFVEMADSLVDDFVLVDLLDNLTTKAAAISGAAAVGLVLSDHRNRVHFMAASNHAGKALELLQIHNNEGPSLEALATGMPVLVVDLAGAAARWPVFAPGALEAGIQSVHSFPMRLRTQFIGALNLFGSEASRFDANQVRVIQALADVATIAILNERNLVQAEAVTEQLQLAINSRIIIEQAKGALAQADGISTSEAFDLLRDHAHSTRRRLVDIAQEFLNSNDKNRVD